MKNITILCFSINTWEKRKARKQQFMIHLAQRGDVSFVLYVEPHLNLFRLIFMPVSELANSENRHRWIRALTFSIEHVADKLHLFTPLFILPFSFRSQFIYNFNLFITSLIIKTKIRLLGMNNIAIWLYHPFDYKILSYFKDRVISIYDWAEYWAEFFMEYSPKRRKNVDLMERSLVAQVDVVFTVSRRLFDIAHTLNKNTYQLLDGTVSSIFTSGIIEVPDDLRNIPRPIALYVGTVFHRVDLELLNLLSQQITSCSIVLVGNIQISEAQKDIIKRPNIFLLGVKEYKLLPAYFANCAVCLLPYIPALVTSPATKVFDYLASGKPIISTELPEMDKYADLVTVTKTPQAFVDAVRQAFTENDPDLAQRRRELASRNSWAARAEEIMSIISQHIGKVK